MKFLLVLVLVLATAACCGGRRAPVNTPGQVVVMGDTTLRVRDDRAIEVTSIRTFREQQASGSAVLRGVALDTAKQSPLTRVAGARAWQSLVLALAADASAAYEALRTALTELGTDYRHVHGRHLNDDTGQTVRLAEMDAQRGDVSAAVTALSGVLQARIDAYVRMYRGQVE